MRSTNDIECTPSEHARHRIEVGGIDIAAEPGRLKGNLTGTAEGVGHSRPMAEAHDAKLLDQLRKGLGTRAEMGVDRIPNVVVNGVHHLFWPLAASTRSR